MLLLFLFALWARFIFDLVRVFVKQWRPKGVVLVLAEISYSVTDPILKRVQKVIPAMPAGPVVLDFAWTICLIGTVFAMNLVRGFTL